MKKPTDWKADDSLFVFGSLMDPDVLSLVSGMLIDTLHMQASTASGFRQCEVSEESYPVLVADHNTQCHGLLINGLTCEALERILFFEGDEYTLESIQVQRETAPDTRSPYLVNAWYFRDTGAYTINPGSWDFGNWQSHHKVSFMQGTKKYMQLFGQMSATEADAYWSEYIDSSNPGRLAS